MLKNPETKNRLTLQITLSLAVCIIEACILGIKPALFTVLSAVLLITVSLIFDRARYKKIAELSDDINRILMGCDNISLNSFSEGELGILQSEIRKMVVKIREQNLALEKDKKLLQTAMADISHQLRTPMTSMNLIISLLRKSDCGKEKQKEYLGELTKLLERTDWLISDILKLSRFEAGVVKLKREQIKLDKLVKFAVKPLEIALEIREIQFEANISDNAVFIGDFNWTAEAVTNILKNCMEHTPNGGKISVQASENPLYCLLEISDTGAGISQKDLPHIFERFYKCDKSTAKGGFGIGLALAKKIVTKQNGYINAENLPSSGAKFTMKFFDTLVQ